MIKEQRGEQNATQLEIKESIFFSSFFSAQIKKFEKWKMFSCLLQIFFLVVVRGANSSVKSARRRWSGNGAVSSSKFSNYSSEYESFPSSWRRNGRVQVGLDIHDSTDLEALNISSVGKPIQSCTMRCSASISVRESSTDFSLHSWHPYHSTFFSVLYFLIVLF